MARFGLLAVIVVVLAVSLQQAVALKCYECDHRTNGCADPFDKSKINQGSYNDCTATLLGSPTCVKVKSTSLGQVLRKCSGSKPEANLECKIGDILADVCEHCDSDGCNGAAQYGPIAMMIISIPIAIVKLFSA